MVRISTRWNRNGDVDDLSRVVVGGQRIIELHTLVVRAEDERALGKGVGSVFCALLVMSATFLLAYKLGLFDGCG